MKYFFLFFFLLPCFLFAQKHDYNWRLGYSINSIYSQGNVLLKFDDYDTHDTLVLSASNLQFGDKTNISSQAGEALLAYDGKYLENKNYQVIDTLYDFAWVNWKSQNSIFLPYPDATNTYVLIHTDDKFISGWGSDMTDVYFTVVDMSMNNGLGGVTIRKEPLVSDTLSDGQITATKHANGRDWWILVGNKGFSKYFTLLLTPTGVEMHHIQETENPLHAGIGQAVFSPDGEYYAIVNIVNNHVGPFVDVFSFDRCTGMLSNQQTMQLDGIVSAGIAFSPNSRFLYVTSGLKLHQYDLWASDIESSKVKLAEFDNWQSVFGLFAYYYLMQLAPDGKIYFCTTNGHKLLHVIEEPNKKGYACNFRPHGLELPTWNTGIPNFPNFRLGPVDGSVCDSLGLDNRPLAKWSYRLDSMDYKKVIFREFSDYLPNSYHWDFGDGTTSAEQEPVHTYAIGGAYDVCLVVSNSNSSDTLCQVVDIDSSLILYPWGEIVVDSFGCWPTTIHIEANTEHADSILWEYCDGTTVLDIKKTNAASLDLDYVLPGIKIVHLTIYNELGSTKVMKRFILYDPPVATIKYYNNGKYHRFAGHSVGLFNEYQWDLGNGTTGTNEVAEVVYDDFGTYEVSLIASNGCGSDTAYYTVTIDSTTFDTLLKPYVYLRADTLYGCAPLQIKYEAITFNADTVTWSFPGGSPSMSHENNVVVTYETPGEYVTEIKVNGSYWYVWQDSSLATVTVVEGVKPNADYIFDVEGLSITTTNQSTNSTSYYWDFGDGTTDTIANPVHTFAQAGNYDIVLISSNDCGSDTLSRNLIITGAEEVIGGMDYIISPNPSRGAFTFEALSPLAGKLDLTVYNLLGQVILRKQLTNGEQKIELDLRSHADGVYWYRVDYLGKVGFGKLVKTN